MTYTPGQLGGGPDPDGAMRGLAVLICFAVIALFLGWIVHSTYFS